MPRLIRIRTKVLMEVLGSLERCSPDPRRNTSKDFFEASLSGNKEETRFHFISTSEGFCVGSGNKAETYFHFRTNHLLVKTASYDAR